MRKKLVILSILLVLGLTSSWVYAKSSTPTDIPVNTNIEEVNTRFRERMIWSKTRVDDALEEGLITKEEANTWNEHFEDMEKFHNENGFIENCHGMGNWHHSGGFRNGTGRRMMRGNRWGR